MRGSRARAIFSMRSSSATFCVESSVAIGSAVPYSRRLPEIFCLVCSFTRLLWPAAAIARTVRAASISEAAEMSSE